MASQVSALKILDWRGLQVMKGEIYFCTQSMAVRVAIDKGHVRDPKFDWMYALVVIANHAPYFLVRDSLEVESGSNVVQMSEPTFWAEVIAKGHALAEIDLVVDYPWVDSTNWPPILQQTFEVPKELRLQISPKDRTLFFVGAPGQSTTISCRKEMLIETLDGLKKTVQYSPQSTQQQLVLRDFPVLTVRTVPGVGYEKEVLCKMTTTLKGEGVSDFGIYQVVDSDGEWRVPYDPTFRSAAIVVHEQKSGLKVGRTMIQLSGGDQNEIVDIVQEMGAITVLDSVGNGIPGAVIVQAGMTIGVTNAEGLAKVPLSERAGKVWFLSKPHDAMSLSSQRLLANPVVYMKAATGVVIDLQSQDLALALEDTLLYSVGNLPFSSVMWVASGQVSQVYGLHTSWGEASGTEVDGEMELDYADYMFELPSSAQQQRVVRIAGVFQVEQETESKIILYDAHEQEIWRDSVAVFPNTVSHRSLLLEDILQTISVQVVDVGGKPVVGANVVTGLGFLLESKLQTNAEGRLSLVVSKKAEIGFQVSKKGYVSQNVVWPLPTGDAIQLESARDLRLQLIDPAGARLAVDVTLTDGISVWHGSTKAQGVFQFDRIPQRALRARITNGGSTFEYEVPAKVEAFTLTHSL